MFLRKISIQVTMHADMLREIIEKFFHSFFSWWLSNEAYFEFIAYSICMNILGYTYNKSEIFNYDE